MARRTPHRPIPRSPVTARRSRLAGHGSPVSTATPVNRFSRKVQPYSGCSELSSVCPATAVSARNDARFGLTRPCRPAIANRLPLTRPCRPETTVILPRNVRVSPQRQSFCPDTAVPTRHDSHFALTRPCQPATTSRFALTRTCRPAPTSRFALTRTVFPEFAHFPPIAA